jgi:hypothetical protein
MRWWIVIMTMRMMRDNAILIVAGDDAIVIRLLIDRISLPNTAVATTMLLALLLLLTTQAKSKSCPIALIKMADR